MAINAYVPFRADQYAYLGGASLGQGIGSGLEKAGEQIGAALEQHKNEAKEADALRQLGITRGWFSSDQAKTLGLPQLRGLHMAKSEQEAADFKTAQEQLYKAHAAEFARRTQEDQQWIEFWKKFSGGNAGGAPGAAPVSPPSPPPAGSLPPPMGAPPGFDQGQAAPSLPSPDSFISTDIAPGQSAATTPFGPEEAPAPPPAPPPPMAAPALPAPPTVPSPNELPPTLPGVPTSGNSPNDLMARIGQAAAASRAPLRSADLYNFAHAAAMLDPTLSGAKGHSAAEADVRLYGQIGSDIANLQAMLAKANDPKMQDMIKEQITEKKDLQTRVKSAIGANADLEPRFTEITDDSGNVVNRGWVDARTGRFTPQPGSAAFAGAGTRLETINFANQIVALERRRAVDMATETDEKKRAAIDASYDAKRAQLLNEHHARLAKMATGVTPKTPGALYYHPKTKQVDTTPLGPEE